MLALLIASPAMAAPGLVPVHGELSWIDRPMQGMVVPVGGTTSLHVSLVDGQQTVWSDTFEIEPDRGRFSVNLGAGAPLDLDLLAAHPDLQIEFAVGDRPPLPRLWLGVVPYAGAAASAASAERVEGVSAEQIDDVLPSEEDFQIIALQECLSTEDAIKALIDDRYHDAGDAVFWHELPDVPAGFADLDDAGFTTYTQVLQALDDRYDTTPDTFLDTDPGLTDAQIPDDVTIDNGTLTTSFNGVGMQVSAAYLLVEAPHVDDGADTTWTFAIDAMSARTGGVAVLDNTRFRRLCADADGCRITIASKPDAVGEDIWAVSDGAVGRLFIAESGTRPWWRFTNTDLEGQDRDTSSVPHEWNVDGCVLSDAEAGATYANRDDVAQGFAFWNSDPNDIDCFIEVRP